MARRKEIGDMALNTMEMHIPTVVELMNSPMACWRTTMGKSCKWVFAKNKFSKPFGN